MCVCSHAGRLILTTNRPFTPARLLLHMARPSTADLKSLQECASLDPEWLREELDEQPYQQLKVAVSKLDLQLWLQEQGLGDAFPILVNEGYTSRNQLCTIDLQEVLKV